MNRFLVIRFEFCKAFYYSLILCKPKSDGIEYRITVMNGEIEKQLCNNNTIREINGFLLLELSGNKLQNKIKMEIGKALGKMIEKPVKEVEKSVQRTGKRVMENNHPSTQADKPASESDERDLKP